IPTPQATEVCYLIPGGQSYRPTEVTIPGDWSGAAAVMAAAAVSGVVNKGSQCLVKGLGATSFSAPDSIIIEGLRAAGVSCTQLTDGWSIHVAGDLKPFTFDLTHAPDLAPALTALAAAIPGASVLKGAGRLKTKESSRGEVLQQIFKQMGVQIDLSADEMMIHGRNRIDVSTGNCIIDCHNDHRIAMAAAIAAVSARYPISLTGASCVSKTYPRFWDDLASLGLKIEKIA
ncbi:MAG: hypothetical protein FWD56_03260, partial [Bacteroidales bacterium]|nr:hypothetical protein [Bacteroidales bacterium]